MSRAVIFERFGGPEVLKVSEVPEPLAGTGEVRVRVAAAGLNPVDWMICANPEMAKMRGITLPSGFCFDLAGVVDQVGADTEGFQVGDRVYGRAMARAAADFVVVPAAPSMLSSLSPTPVGISDPVAAALPTPGLTASAALERIGLQAGDTIVVGGAAGGVGVLAVQLAKLEGARVIGTASPSTFEFLRALGVEPIEHGPGLIDRIRATAPDGITAATDLFSTETAEAALALGVPPQRISTIAVGPNPPGGVRATGGYDAQPGALDRITSAILAGQITVPIAATFPLEQIRDAVTLQTRRHTHGKIVLLLSD